MAEKKPKKDQAEQSEKFLKKVQELIDAGELSPTEAEGQFDRVIDAIAESKRPPPKTPQ